MRIALGTLLGLLIPLAATPAYASGGLPGQQPPGGLPGRAGPGELAALAAQVAARAAHLPPGLPPGGVQAAPTYHVGTGGQPPAQPPGQYLPLPAHAGQPLPAAQANAPLQLPPWPDTAAHLPAAVPQANNQYGSVSHLAQSTEQPVQQLPQWNHYAAPPEWRAVLAQPIQYTQLPPEGPVPVFRYQSPGGRQMTYAHLPPEPTQGPHGFTAAPVRPGGFNPHR